ncbi:MAG TPA: CDP-alcohol phosphatidyltransferase family protein [Mycobacterium sp.]|nr:CDP-alcohol phosphatidyltransferase family protein [Mycobacterium sp.]
MSRLHFLSRATFTGITTPVAKAFLRAGFTADIATIVGTAGAVLAALTLFPVGRLFAGTMVVWFFVLFDMLDGAIARESGGGSRFGAVLDATCDRISDGAVFCGLAWWAAFGMGSASLAVATLICLVTSQVISYIKARAEASGLRGDGGVIERPERLIIVLVGAGLSDLPGFPLPWVLQVAMWLLAVTSLITCVQRLHTVRVSPGAVDPLHPAGDGPDQEGPQP